MMNIVCCPDHKYIMPAGVMIYSVCKNHQINTITFYIICNDDVTPKDQQKLKNIITKFNNEVIFYNIKFNIPECFTIKEGNQSKHIKISAYYRIFLTDVLPKNLNKVLYLDADLIVNRSLLNLYNKNIEKIGIAAVYDSCFQNIDCYKRLGIERKHGYFNSGVLLINLDYWRKNNIKQKSIEIANQKKGKLKYHDQDILNCIFQENKIILPFTYNLSSGFLYHDYTLPNKYQEELNNAINDPHIIHYTGSSKPWHSSSIHPYRQAFIHNFKNTCWYNPIKFTISVVKQRIWCFYNTIIYKKLNENPYIL